MLIEMKTLATGPNGNLYPGKRYDLPAKQAQAFIEGGYAVEVTNSAPPVSVETATASAPETADAPKPKAKR